MHTFQLSFLMLLFASLSVANAKSTSSAATNGGAAFGSTINNASSSQKRRTATAWTTAAATASLALTLASAPAFADDAGIKNGAVLFQASCAGCHAGGQNFMAEKKTLQQAALQKYQSMDPVQLQKFVQTGMPHKMLPIKFSDQDYAEVTSFVVDQALGEKW